MQGAKHDLPWSQGSEDKSSWRGFVEKRYRILVFSHYQFFTERVNGYDGNK